MPFNTRNKCFPPRLTAAAVLLCGAVVLSTAALAAPPTHRGVLVHLDANQVAAFDARHGTQAVRLNPHRDVYLVTASGRSDQDLLDELQTDSAAGDPEPNITIQMEGTGETRLDGQSTASVLNGQSTASVLNGWSEFFGAHVPGAYLDQPAVGQIGAGAPAYELATGRGAIVALVDNGVDPANPVLNRVLLRRQGYNFYDGTGDWSAYADLNGQSTASVLNGQSTASVLNGTGSVFGGEHSTVYVLNGQSTASVLNGQSTASVLNDVPCPAGGVASVLSGQSTASVLNGQSTASVLNGQSTASVLNGQSTASVLNGQSTASVLNDLAVMAACYPEFGHGTAVAGLIHLVAPEALILPIKAFGPDGSADAASIYQSITYAIDQHANVINLSFSAVDTTGDIRGAVAEAVSDGIVVTAAAGNANSAAAVFPASLQGVIGVGAVDGTAPHTTFPKADFSNFDPGVGQIVDVDVAAPGVNLFTTYPGFGLLWSVSTGTSFSVPLVSGEAALLVQRGASGGASRGDIEATANPAIAGDAGGGLGHGLIAVTDALELAPGGNSSGHGHGFGRGHVTGRR